MADSSHGLKDLFGSVPDSDDASPGGASASPKPASKPAAPVGTADVDLSQAIDKLVSRTEPSAAPEAGQAPMIDAPNMAPLPPDFEATPAPGAPVIQGVPAQTQAPMPSPTPSAPVTPAAPMAPAAPAGVGLGMVSGLSVVVVARGGVAASRRTIQALRLQTVASGLDVVIVADEPAAVSGADFARLQSVVAPGGASYGTMAAMGAQAASGELVAILADYAFPARDWAEAVLSHRNDRFAALGSALGNANPRSALSWGNMLLEHGAWREGTRRDADGVVDRLPMRNLVYRRDALLALGPSLPALLDSGEAGPTLAANGDPLKLQDEARLALLNPSTRGATIKGRFAAGRLAAAREAKDASIVKRLGKATAAAFGGPARYAREKPRVFQGSDASVNPKMQGRAVLLAMTAEGWGRAAGYLRGPGRAAQTRERMQAQRAQTLNKVDRKQFGA